MQTDPPATAADLARRCLAAMEAKDNDAMATLFHPQARWELAYAMEGQSDAERTLQGRNIARFHAHMFKIIESARFVDVQIEAIPPHAALLLCRSQAVLASGDHYGNFYAVRVQASEGRILHWLEFYDPRPAERVRAVLARSLTGAPGG